MKNRLCSALIKWGESAIALFISGIVAFFFLINGPLHPWRLGVTLTDSSVFKTVALMMEKGYMPYRDTFDHKGPLIYAINYLGARIAYYRGVWLLELVFLMVTIFLLYKIARLKVRVLSSVLVTLTAFSMLFDFFEGGNFTEEYAMMFIAIGIYIFLDYLLYNRISCFRIALSGIAMGGVCLLRANMIAVWVVFCIAIFFMKIVKAEWKQLRQFVLWFIIGLSIIIVPFAIWLWVNDALSSCIEDYILFNMHYSSADGGLALFSNKWNSFWTFASETVYVFALVGILYSIRKNRFVHVTYVVYMILGLVFLCMSGMRYQHYGMVLIPTVVYPLSLITESMENLPDKGVAVVGKMLLSAYVVSTIIVPTSIKTLCSIPSYYENRDKEHYDENTTQISEMVLNMTNEDDAISVYGNMDIIYVLTQRRHATKYSYQYPIGYVMPEIMDEYMEQLEEELPSIVVVQNGHYDDDIRTFLDRYGYNIVWPVYDAEVDYDSNDLVFYR